MNLRNGPSLVCFVQFEHVVAHTLHVRAFYAFVPYFSYRTKQVLMSCPRLVSFNCMSAASEERLEWILSAIRHRRANIIGLEGTRRRLVDTARGFDELHIAGFIVVSFGTLALNESDKHAGVAIALDANLFDRNAIINIWSPNECNGRLGLIRLKRRTPTYRYIQRTGPHQPTGHHAMRR